MSLMPLKKKLPRRSQLNTKLCMVGDCGCTAFKLGYCYEHHRVFRTGVLPERKEHKVGGKCSTCGEAVSAKEAYKAAGLTFHKDCFVCTVCQVNLCGKQTGFEEGKFYCEKDYMALFSAICAKCKKPITGGIVEALGQKWCEPCFGCEGCGKVLDDQVYNVGGRPHCLPCYKKVDLRDVTCDKCKGHISDYAQLRESMGKSFHIDCFRCRIGGHKILDKHNFFQTGDRLYCERHWEEGKHADTCFRCHKLIKLEFVKAGDREFHPECFSCMACKEDITVGESREARGMYFCGKCYSKVPKDGKGIYINGVYIPPDAAHTRARWLRKGYGEMEARPGSVPPTDSKSYSYAELAKSISRVPPTVDYRQREQYLSDADFKQVFKMTKEEFKALPTWRISALKKEKGLF